MARLAWFLLIAVAALGGSEIALARPAMLGAAADKCRQSAKRVGMGSSYNASLEKICGRFGCEPELVAALITVESNWNPYATRYEANYQWLHEPERHARRHGISREAEAHFQRYSWGLLQIIGATAREMGFNLPMQALCEPMIGIEYGIRYLMALKRNYRVRDDLIAAYNSGSAKKGANGKYLNQNYVDKVNRVLKKHDYSR